MSTPSADERTIIRQQVGKDYPDATIDLYWTDAGEEYKDKTARVIRQATIVALLRTRLAEVASSVDYQMNEQRESASQEAHAVQGLLNDAIAKLEEVSRPKQVAVGFLKGRKRDVNI